MELESWRVVVVLTDWSASVSLAASACNAARVTWREGRVIASFPCEVRLPRCAGKWQARCLRSSHKYDAENHVVAAGVNFVTNNTAPTSQYFYDAAGKRTRKLVSGVETWFVYGIDGELVAEYNANAVVTSPQKEYGYRGGQLLVVYDNTEPLADKKLQWMVADHLGTPRMVIDKTGSLSGIKRHDYLPFGEEIGANVGIRSVGNGYTADQIKQKFTGKRRDDETNLDFFEARYFSSKQGRFTSPDMPFADQNPSDPQSWNLYSYVRNNPLTYTDPTGRGRVGDFFQKIKNGILIGEMLTNAERKKESERKRGELQYWLNSGAEGETREISQDGKKLSPDTMTDAQVWLFTKKLNEGDVQVEVAIPQVPAPALKGDPYHPDQVDKRVRPDYRANPAHVKGANPNKTPEPPDAAAVYGSSVRSGMGTWFGKGADGQIYRFFSDNAGGAHFSGIIPKARVPNEILKQLGF